jgi:hypothetical protein
MNICSKINSRAAPNGMVIGQGLRLKLDENGDYIVKRWINMVSILYFQLHVSRKEKY